MTPSISNQSSLFRRFLTYQQERFPLLVHIPLIAAFSFSAIAYSRMCRGAGGFIRWQDYAFCVATNIILFFLLRVSDEHKDHDDDTQYRTYLPVIRGLISLRELRAMACVLLGVATVINVWRYPMLLPLYLLMMGYLLLMRYEFFIPAWLKRHQVAYIVSHMLIIPLADIYASSYDWKLEHAAAPMGLLFFFGVSFLNGLVLEVGRKLRMPQAEEPGVVSYTNLWGARGGPAAWVGILTVNFALACIAAHYAGHAGVAYIVLSILYVLAILPAILILVKPVAFHTKWIELMSVLWALGMYLVLGGIPLLIRLFGGQ